MAELNSPIVLIVVENGATWPRWVDHCGAEEGDFSRSSRVLVQDERESPAAFAERVDDYISELSNERIAIGAIACSERSDVSAIDARRAIGNRVLRSMSKQKRGRVCFSEAKRSSGRSRHLLSSLVSELEQQWADSGVEISIRFSSDQELPSRVA